MLFFWSPQYCCFQNSQFNNTLLYQHEGRVNTVTKISTYLSFKFLVETIRHHYYCMLVKSFIWLTRVWFHHMFRSRVEYFYSLIFFVFITSHIIALELNTSLFKVVLNTRSRFCTIWESNIETFERLFYMIQSGCSIYSHFVKPLHWNIHELWHQAFIVMKITEHSFFYKSQ